ncbi:MAG: GNAT family N-acetyltransferase [Bacillota bacterium]
MLADFVSGGSPAKDAAVRWLCEGDVALGRVFSQAEERPWGVLFANSANPEHHDANKAYVLRDMGSAAEAVIDEVTAFYRGRGLPPRVNAKPFCDQPDFAERLQRRGFKVAAIRVRVMVWDGVPAATRAPALPAGVAIDPAGLADLEALARGRAEANGWEPGWVKRQLTYQLEQEGLRYFLATVDGEPAACACLVELTEPQRLEYVATRPGFRRRGLAGAVVGRIQREAAGPLILGCVDEGAERLYARAGFSVRAEYSEVDAWLEP